MFKILLTGALLVPLASPYGPLHADDPLPDGPVPAAPNSDPEEQQKLAGWGKIIDPEGKCEFVAGEDELLIKLSGQPRGLSAERNQLNAPRVMQTVEGDFAISATVDGNLPLPQTNQNASSAYISGGLLLMLDDNNYVRLERASFSRNGKENFYANFEMWNAGRSVRMGRFADFPLRSDQPVELRLELKQNKVRALVRRQDDNWHELGIAEIPAHEKLLAGVHTINSTGMPVPVRFSRFFLAAPFDVAQANTNSPIRLRPIVARALPGIAQQRIPNRVANDLFAPENMALQRIAPQRDPELNEMVKAVQELQRRARSIATMTDDEKNQLILDARILVVSDSRYSPQMLPSVVGGLSNDFRRAGDWQSAINTYRAFANALAESDNEQLRRQAPQMISAAEKLEDQHQQNRDR